MEAWGAAFPPRSQGSVRPGLVRPLERPSDAARGTAPPCPLHGRLLAARELGLVNTRVALGAELCVRVLSVLRGKGTSEACWHLSSTSSSFFVARIRDVRRDDLAQRALRRNRHIKLIDLAAPSRSSCAHGGVIHRSRDTHTRRRCPQRCECRSADEWTKKMWHMRATDHSSALSKRTGLQRSYTAFL